MYKIIRVTRSYPEEIFQGNSNQSQHSKLILTTFQDEYKIIGLGFKSDDVTKVILPQFLHQWNANNGFQGIFERSKNKKHYFKNYHPYRRRKLIWNCPQGSMKREFKGIRSYGELSSFKTNTRWIQNLTEVSAGYNIKIYLWLGTHANSPATSSADTEWLGWHKNGHQETNIPLVREQEGRIFMLSWASGKDSNPWYHHP